MFFLDISKTEEGHRF